MAEQFPGLIVIGCFTHRGNFLGKDISENQQDIIANVISVLKWLKNTHLGTSELKTAAIARQPLPATTRWNEFTKRFAGIFYGQLGSHQSECIRESAEQ